MLHLLLLTKSPGPGTRVLVLLQFTKGLGPERLTRVTATFITVFMGYSCDSMDLAISS
jgi:hypothetical protein